MITLFHKYTLNAIKHCTLRAKIRKEWETRNIYGMKCGEIVFYTRECKYIKILAFSVLKFINVYMNNFGFSYFLTKIIF